MTKRILFIFGGAIGDALLGVQLARTLAAAGSDATLTLVSTRKNYFLRQLMESVPQAAYRELPRGSVHSWLALVELALAPHGAVFLEPFQDTVPLWWKIIARMVTLAPGSIEVRCQSRPRLTPARVRVLPYNPKTDHLFSVITRVAPLFGASPVQEPAPSLPAPSCGPLHKRPHLLFHFFAGAYRRSFPVEKVRPLLEAAREQFPTHAFILTCGHGEEAAAQRMAKGIPEVSVEANPSAQKLLCLLAQSDAVVGVASGVTLIATHLEAPTVVLCNLSDPCWLPTYAKNAVLLSAPERCVCNGDKTGECSVETQGGGVYRCLYDITIPDIIAAMSRMLQRQ